MMNGTAVGRGLAAEKETEESEFCTVGDSRTRTTPIKLRFFKVLVDYSVRRRSDWMSTGNADKLLLVMMPFNEKIASYGNLSNP